MQDSDSVRFNHVSIRYPWSHLRLQRVELGVYKNFVASKRVSKTFHQISLIRGERRDIQLTFLSASSIAKSHRPAPLRLTHLDPYLPRTMTVKAVIGGVLALASLVKGAGNVSPFVSNNVHTHTLQLNLELVNEEFTKSGYHSTFEVVPPFPSVDDYTGPINYGNNAINAPLNCLGDNTHLGCHAYLDGQYDPNRCADDCTATTEYDLTHGYADRPCRFFNTYILNKNGVPFAQYCSLVSSTYPQGMIEQV